MNNFQRVFKNTSYLFFSEIFLKALGLLWVIFLARSLSIELYGRYNLVNSFISIFSFLPDLGIGLIVIREIAKKKENASIYLGTSLLLNGILATSTIFVIFLVLFVLNYPMPVKTLIVIASFTLFLSTLRSVGIFFFDGTERMGFSAILNSLNTLFLIGFGFLGLILGFGLLGVFMGMLLGTLVSLFTTWVILLKQFVIPRLILNKKLIKHFLIEGLPLGLASFSFMIYTRIDSVILNQMLGERSVGIYNSATPFVFSIIGLLNVPFVVAVYPALSRLSSNKDSKRFSKAIKKSLLFIALWSFPLAIFVSYVAPFIIPFIFGQRYVEAIPVLQTLILFVPFASLSALLYKVLIVLNKQKQYLFISLIGAILNIVLNLIMIPKFFIMGAALSSVITQIILFTIYIFIVSRYVFILKK